MELFYFKPPRESNFGDDLNRWMWRRVLPGCWQPDDGVLFSGIGTLISRDLMRDSTRRWIVLGSGVGYAPPPAGFGDSRWSILAVRGPLSAEILRLDPALGVLDAAALIHTLPEFSPLPESERKGTVFMPHYEALGDGNWAEACRLAGIDFLDPRTDSTVTLQRIRRAKLVIADAMHAAITADSLRVPWVPVQTSPNINAFKWLDWAISLQLPYEPVRLPPSSFIEALRSKTLGWYGERLTLRCPTPEAAIADYRSKCRLKQKPWWNFYRYKCETAVYRVPKRILQLRPGHRLRGAFDRAQVEVAAAALSAAVSTRPYLSPDAVFQEKLERLAHGLECVPAILERLARPLREACGAAIA